MTYEIKIQRTQASKLSQVDFNNLPFGKVFSDHMFVADYQDGQWQNFRIEPFGSFSISPANLTLHYGQAIFEGMKASKDANGTPLLFRIDRHLQRINESARRMAMPEVPEELFTQALEGLMRLDYKWIPEVPNALYLRPFMFATDEYLGVGKSKTYKFIIFTGPVGPFYPKPVRLLISTKYIRAAKGGVGAAKTAGNYAATLMPMEEARAAGYDQILWLSTDFKYIQECGTMNIFFIIGDTIVTPPITDGTILKGITRDCFINLLRGKGHKVEERPVSVDELVEAHQKGILMDAFGAGTAVVVAPVSDITYKEHVLSLPPLEERHISIALKEELNNIRSARIADNHNWLRPVKVQKEAMVEK